MKILHLLLLGILCSCHNNNDSLTKDAKLIMAIDMVRHGDRSPNDFIPNVMEGLWKKSEIAQLTNKGIEESKKTGDKFKNYYINKLRFLSLTASSSQIYVRSTDFIRTKDTAKAILTGMFGDRARNIDINFNDFTTDACNGFAKNKAAEKKIDEILNNNIPNNFKEHLNTAISFINKKYKTNFSYPYGISKFGDFLYVNKIHHKPLPQGISSSEAEKIIDLTMQRFLYVWSVPARNCLHSLDLIKEVEDLFANKIHHNNKAKDLKYVLLTMHDTNIAPLLLFLNYPITTRPKYNADLRFELLEKEKTFYVRTSFNEETFNICQKELCTFNEFKEKIHEFINDKCNDFSINYDYLKRTNILGL